MKVCVYVRVLVCILVYICCIRSTMRKLGQHSSIALNNVEEVVKELQTVLRITLVKVGKYMPRKSFVC